MPEMIVKQDAVRSQATLKKVEEEIDPKHAGGNKQQSYARNEQLKAQAKKQAEEAEVRKKLQQNEKKVAGLEGKKHELEKKAAGGKNDKKGDHTPAEKAKTEHVEKKKESAKKGEVAAHANEKKHAEVKAAKVPDKETVKHAKEKTDAAEHEHDKTHKHEKQAKKTEHEEVKEGKTPAAHVAADKAKTKPDAAATQLKVVKDTLEKAYEEQKVLTRQLIGILNGLAGLETNAEKRKKLAGEAKGKLAEQVESLEEKQSSLRA